MQSRPRYAIRPSHTRATARERECVYVCANPAEDYGSLIYCCCCCCVSADFLFLHARSFEEARYAATYPAFRFLYFFPFRSALAMPFISERLHPLPLFPSSLFLLLPYCSVFYGQLKRGSDREAFVAERESAANLPKLFRRGAARASIGSGRCVRLMLAETGKPVNEVRSDSAR